MLVVRVAGSVCAIPPRRSHGLGPTARGGSRMTFPCSSTSREASRSGVGHGVGRCRSGADPGTRRVGRALRVADRVEDRLRDRRVGARRRSSMLTPSEPHVSDGVQRLTRRFEHLRARRRSSRVWLRESGCRVPGQPDAVVAMRRTPATGADSCGGTFSFGPRYAVGVSANGAPQNCVCMPSTTGQLAGTSTCTPW